MFPTAKSPFIFLTSSSAAWIRSSMVMQLPATRRAALLAALKTAFLMFPPIKYFSHSCIQREYVPANSNLWASALKLILSAIGASAKKLSFQNAELDGYTLRNVSSPEFRPEVGFWNREFDYILQSPEECCIYTCGGHFEFIERRKNRWRIFAMRFVVRITTPLNFSIWYNRSPYEIINERNQLNHSHTVSTLA